MRHRVHGPKIIQELRNLKTDKGVLQLEKGYLEAEVRKLSATVDNPRNFLAHHFIRGNGIEIGAAQYPVTLPPKASVRYVDIFTADDLRKAHPTVYSKADLVEVSVVDDAEKLTRFKPSSLDFIIANHFVEHCLDPLGTIINMYKKLRNKGVLYFAIPDKRYTFDKRRAITTYEHLLAEKRDRKKTFLREHTEDFLRLGEVYTGKDFDQEVQRVIDSGYRIHYHVWTQKEMTEMFIRLSEDFKIDLEIEALLKNGHEVIYVLRKY